MERHYPGLVPPRNATPRDFSRATYGAHTAAAAAALGQPLLPWQRYAADLFGEVDDDGDLAYGLCVTTVQRQAGKTTLDLANDIQNCLMGPNRRVWYTAQSGQHASDKWKEMAELFEKSPLKRLGKIRWSNGTQTITFLNGSTLRPHPPTADSLHSKQSDKNTIDEAWYFSAVQAAGLNGAITPTTTTRRKVTGIRPQKWILSTEGTLESAYLNKTLDECREYTPPGCAFLDFGIPMDLEDPDMNDDAAIEAWLDIVYAYHPGAGFLFGRDDLRNWLDGPDGLGLPEFKRAYGNRRTGATERVIPEAPWKAAATLAALPAGAPICFAASVGMDGVDTAISATAIADGRKISEIVDHRPGTGHALERIKALHAKHGAPFAIDPYGPSADLYDQAKRAGIPLVEIKTAGVSAACQSVFAGIVPPKGAPAGWKPTWHYRPHPALDDAAELAAKRSVGDGAWCWGRRASVGSVSALEAVTLGTWGIDHMPEVLGIQVF